VYVVAAHGTVADWQGFCKVITGEMHRDRLLGKSQTVSVASAAP
jgi:hypothetical protein